MKYLDSILSFIITVVGLLVPQKKKRCRAAIYPAPCPHPYPCGDRGDPIPCYERDNGLLTQGGI